VLIRFHNKPLTSYFMNMLSGGGQIFVLHIVKLCNPQECAFHMW
jgi:hypothetical protein